MLALLSIRNFALVEELHLEFAPGFNVLTGETGAGKSILIDALGAALGARVGGEAVRSGSARAVVEAVFTVSAAEEERFPAVREWAEEGQLILARELTAGGRSSCRLNGRLCPAATLRQVAADLIDIHGQHDHQSLLHPARHVEFLDAWAGQEAATRRRQVLALHGELQRARQELGRAATGEREREQRLDLLRFQREEIDAAAPCPGEEETLRTERDRLANAERLCAGAAAALAALEDREPGAGDLLAAAAREAETMAALDAGVLPVAELLASALVAVREAVAELRLYVDSLEVSPERLEQVQERLETYRRLRRKYGDTVAEVLEYRARLEAELEALAGGEEQRARLTATCERLATLVDAEAGALHAVRSAAAARFEGEIARHLADLNMAGTRFAVRLEPPAPAGQGGGAVLGSAEFLLAANAGEPLRPLARIASGGELSRVMLALKTAMAGSHPVALIFDEVDAGVGGRTAQALGAKMAELSRANQVLCVTHLPQIACLAHRHLQVRKRTVAGRTLVEVAPLEGEARVGELARMLGGAEATAAQHARQLLAAAAS